ncbi:MAG: hypothetical protein XXXJIFNMEKO3_01931 [Candidatus Erwinia impunctatus]|nr:hypothetical protein XXXJIFNMEKO_01931 [Culicoides impunctatus]
MWKIIEPPADAPYFKAHVAHESLAAGELRIIAASRRGRSHEHAGSFRDGDYFIRHSSQSGWSVMLVADGAGSAKNSREGSRIATDTAGNCLFEQLQGDAGLTLKTRVLEWKEEDQRFIKEAMLRYFSQAIKLAVNRIENEAIQAEKPRKSYATTLLATLTFRHQDTLFAASFWLGDGAIAAYGPRGKVRILGLPDSGEYAGQTRFLDSDIADDPAFGARISIGKWHDVSHLLLMSDGITDPVFETDNGLHDGQKWDKLIAAITPSLAETETASQQLAEWLTFFSPGNHDDRTIIVAW